MILCCLLLGSLFDITNFSKYKCWEVPLLNNATK